jgi:hypothetical protein
MAIISAMAPIVRPRSKIYINIDLFEGGDLKAVQNVHHFYNESRLF